MNEINRRLWKETGQTPSRHARIAAAIKGLWAVQPLEKANRGQDGRIIMELPTEVREVGDLWQALEGQDGTALQRYVEERDSGSNR